MIPLFLSRPGSTCIDFDSVSVNKHCSCINAYEGNPYSGCVQRGTPGPKVQAIFKNEEYFSINVTWTWDYEVGTPVTFTVFITQDGPLVDYYEVEYEVDGTESSLLVDIEVAHFVYVKVCATTQYFCRKTVFSGAICSYNSVYNIAVGCQL